jgi:hypothetical protein
MKTLDFARAQIRFDKSSPITGPFRDEFYPFLRAPFNAADSIECKRLVIFKASSCMGTVAGQIINLKRIVCDVGDQMIVCQTDDDAATWAKTRGKEWIRSNPDAMRLLSRDKYAMTNDLVLFRTKFLQITGPGISSAQSVQVRYCQTDESHLESYPDGRLIEFEKRMGGRWDRQGTHITTAPDEGREVATFYLAGQQDEWHFRCPKCAQLFWPLWGEDARQKYGTDVFRPTLESVVCVCPHCKAEFADTARERYALNKDGDYVAQNPTAPPETRSFRWSVFAAHWISWREMLIESNSAMDAAKIGNLKPWEDFEKKRLCKIYVPRLPDFGDAKGNRDYRLGDVWQPGGETLRVLSCDPQAGKAGEPAHRHALVTEWDRQGNSRRVCYRRIDTAAQLHEMAAEFGVSEGKPGTNSHVIIDSGHEPRRTFRECGQFGWYAFKGSDLQQFHAIKQGIGADAMNVTHPMPYSQPEPQSGVVGEALPKSARKVRVGRLPDGWAYCITSHNPELYGYLYALITGTSGRYFGIAQDMPECYVKNMPGFMPLIEPDKKTATVKKIVWKKIREDHYWDLEILALVIAIRSGFFPLGKQSEIDTPPAPV